jgi:hypothetical protein
MSSALFSWTSSPATTTFLFLCSNVDLISMVTSISLKGFGSRLFFSIFLSAFCNLFCRFSSLDLVSIGSAFDFFFFPGAADRGAEECRSCNGTSAVDGGQRGIERAGHSRRRRENMAPEGRKEVLKEPLRH